MKEIKKFSLTLFLICLIASFCLSVVYAVTKPQIEKQKLSEEMQSLKEVVPEAKNFEPVKKDDQILYYKAQDEKGQTLAFVFKAYGKGYSSTIETMVGMTNDGKIINIKIISHNETPGLGSRIAEIEQETTIWDKIKGKISRVSAKPKFQAQFSNVAVDELDKIDTVSGATISSQAVIKSVKEKCQEILKLIKENQ